ncbi:MAG: Allantoicase [Labilithrix sp.]|nr:Allantoicase [Labilithrix sp.]
MSDLTHLVDLAAERLGGSVLWASDDFFASKDNLLKPQEAVFIEGKYTDRGKWMDGWESRRRRDYAFTTPGPHPDFDSAIIRLGLPGLVRAVVVDTAFFTGNYPQACALEGASIEGHPSLATLLSDAITWTPILPREQATLKGGSKNYFEIAGASRRFTHLRFHIYPDGGVARLRVHGEVLPSARWLGSRARPQLVDLAAAENGALVVACNDMFFGSRHNLIMPGRGVNMGDGWETKRGRRPGPDWVVTRLATEGLIERVVLDTLHFKGNAPDFASLEVASVPPGAPDPDGSKDEGWVPLLARTSLQPHTPHVFEDELAALPGSHTPATHVRMRIWPDGGVSRLRLFGLATDQGRERAGMQYLRAMPEPELVAALTSCCGSSRFVRELAAERQRDPAAFATLASLKERAAQIWQRLATTDWDEAFRAHPRIGEQKAAATQSATAKAWSKGEQSSVDAASQATRDALQQTNRAYEERFSRIYIVCATGKSIEEMLEIAKERMQNDPETELRRAVDEQRKITELRLEKLVLR